MKSIRILLISILLFISYSSHSQSETAGDKNPDGTIILDKSKTLQTDIFILDTKEPNQLSIVRMYDDYRQVKDIPARKLSINVNRFSTFKIININPNRYRYSINNALVTQFMDNDPFSTKNNKFSDGSSLPINKIEIIELFNADKNSETKKAKIEDKKKEITSMILQIQKASEQISDLKIQYDEPKNKKEQSDIQKRINAIDIKTSISKYNEAITEYGIMVNSLTVNANNLLENFKIGGDDIVNASDDAKKTFREIYNLAQKLESETQKMDDIKKGIKELMSDNIKDLDALGYTKGGKNNFYDERKNQSLDPVTKLSSIYGYNVNLEYLNSNVASERSLELTKMDEFISNKKVTEWELFVLNTSKEIGKLLQNKFIEYSEIRNDIKMQTCIDQSYEDNILESSNKLRFDSKLIRNIGADINVLIKYLELNDNVFGSIVNGINNNYNRLMDYLTVLNFTTNSNTIEFTLPTHTNLKNVDFIRYEINRQDVITQSNQNYVYDIWIVGGLKIDFSAGIFATSLIDYNFEKVQAYSKLDPSILLIDSVSINRKDNGNFDFAFGGMVNISYRTGAGWITPGISLGTAFANNQKLQFLGAFSLQLGKTERIILHGGFAAGFSKTLDLASLNYDRTTANDDGKNYIVKGTYENFNIPTIDKFQFKPFFGISYNLSKKNALQAVSNANDYSPKSKDGVIKPEAIPK